MSPGSRLHRFWLRYRQWSVTVDGDLTWWSSDDTHHRTRRLDHELQLPRWPWKLLCRGQHDPYYGECVICGTPMPADQQPLRKVWYWPPWQLTGPVFGVPGARPPVWRSADEHGRRTIVLQVPLLGAVIVAVSPPTRNDSTGR